MRSMQSRGFRHLVALVGAVLLLTACGTAAPVEQPAVGGQAPAALPSPIASEAQAEPTSGELPDAAEPATSEPATAPEATATVDVSPNLRASDPATVNLASGEPQLVEFFAFW